MIKTLGMRPPPESAATMLSHPLRYLVSDTDRHGNVRLYVRRPGSKKVRLRAAIGTPAFLEEYRTAVANVEATAARAVASGQGSFRSLCVLYFGSHEFLRLDASTRNWRRRALEKICEAHGSKPVALLDVKAVRMLRDELAASPGAANGRLKALKAMFSWAVEAQEAERNPARDVRLVRYASTGWHSWTAEEIAQYEAKHQIGTKARLAMALILYTACRREDAPRFGPQHFKNGRTRFVHGKNEHRRPVAIDMVTPTPLQAVIDATACSNMTYLVTEFGKPFTTAGFGNKFRDWCDEAGLTHCSAHGLRKAMAALLAEADATPHQIGAVTGHSSLEEIERYTRGAQRRKLADAAVAKLAKG